MKRLLAALMLSIAPGFAFAATATLQVQGMTCSYCAQKIEARLKENPAVAQVTVDVASGTVVIESAGGAMLEDAALREAVTGAGDYTVTQAEYR